MNIANRDQHYCESTKKRNIDKPLMSIASNITASRPMKRAIVVLICAVPLLTAVTAKPTAFVSLDGTDYIVYRGVNNHIETVYLPHNGSGGATWKSGDLTALTAAPPAVGDPTAFVSRDGTDYVVYRGANSHIETIYLPQNGSGGVNWKFGDLSVLTGAPAAY